MYRLILAAGLVICIAGCNPSEGKMKDEVRKRLKDPSSAKFSQIKFERTPKGTRTVMCGNVNAKNGFGGYAGETPFTVTYVIPEDRISVDVSDFASCSHAVFRARADEFLSEDKEPSGRH